ncbi:PAS domain S-box protein [Leptospira stimsonii]|nr:PAS domain S-box protein [Leptospira stimsonii]
MGTIVDNSDRQFEFIKNEKNEIQIILQILDLFSKVLSGKLLSDQALPLVLEKISAISDWTRAELWMIDDASKTFYLKAAFGAETKPEETFAHDSKRITVPASEEFLLRLVNEQKTIWSNDPKDEVRYEHILRTSHPAPKTVFGIPILSQKKKSGALIFYSEQAKNAQDETFISWIENVAYQMGSLIFEKVEVPFTQGNEDRIGQVLENMPVMFFSVDEQFRILSWNHECENVTGYEKEEVIGKERFFKDQLLGIQDYGNSSEFYHQSVDSDFKNWELEIKSKTGKIKTIAMSNISTEFPIAGWKHWFVGVDVTLTKEVEKNLKSSLKELSDFHTALNAVSIVAITDKLGNIIYVNQNFCNISGYSKNELLGRNHRIINSGYHPKEFFIELWKTISKGKIWKGEIKNKSKDGKFYWVDTTISPIFDENGKPHQYLAIRNDITERKETEEKVRLTENNLKTLQDRMSPHFLFNTLSIIHSYLQTNSELADSAILMLAENYRFLIDNAQRALIPFDVEWEFMENYMKLLKLRFSDFLDIEVVKKGDFSKCQLPPLTLQPIVENSYIHGIRNQKGGGKISVEATIEGNRTRIRIRDNGKGIENTENFYSRTLNNISERLKFYLYESEVKIENHADGGTLVTVDFDTPKNEQLGKLN